MPEQDGFYIGLMFEEAAASHPRAEAALDLPLQLAPADGTALTVARLAELVRRTAGRLLSAGVRPGRHVAVHKTNTFDIAVLAMAAQRVGAVPALLSPALDRDTVHGLLARLDSPWLLTDRQTYLAKDLGASGARALLIDAAGPDGAPPPTPGAQYLAEYAVRDLSGTRVPAPDEPAFISHTSGTTGLPKMAVQTPDALWERVRLQKAFADKLWRRERVALCVSMVHARFYTALYLGLSYGNPILVAADDSPAVIGPLFARHRPGVVETQPNSFVDWETLANAEGDPLAGVRYYNATFDAVHPRTVQVLLDSSRRQSPKFFQLYGQTETGPVAGRWFSRRDAAGMDARCVGRALPGVTRLRVVDDSGAPVPRGVAGHIEVGSRTLAVAYLGEEERYRNQVHEGWWRMGDIGYLDGLDRLHLLDRAIDRVGSVVSNLEIEDTLMRRLPELREIVVVADEAGRPVPVVCTRDDSPLDPARWHEAVADLEAIDDAVQLPYDMLPRTATRKIRRPELAGLLAGGAAGVRIPASGEPVGAPVGQGSARG